jgi:hypothetical protein
MVMTKKGYRMEIAEGAEAFRCHCAPPTLFDTFLARHTADDAYGRDLDPPSRNLDAGSTIYRKEVASTKFLQSRSFKFEELQSRLLALVIETQLGVVSVPHRQT